MRYMNIHIAISGIVIRSYSKTACGFDACMNGFCNLVDGEPSCSCVVGYEGELCEQVIDDFADLTCVNGFAKWVDFDVAACICDDGWTGDSCSEIIEDWDVCTNVVCNGQGRCTIAEA